MPGSIRTTGERDRCFSSLILDGAPVSLRGVYSIYTFYTWTDLSGATATCIVRSISSGGYKLMPSANLTKRFERIINHLGKV